MIYPSATAYVSDHLHIIVSPLNISARTYSYLKTKVLKRMRGYPGTHFEHYTNQCLTCQKLAVVKIARLES